MRTLALALALAACGGGAPAEAPTPTPPPEPPSADAAVQAPSDAAPSDLTFALVDVTPVDAGDDGAAAVRSRAATGTVVLRFTRGGQTEQRPVETLELTCQGAACWDAEIDLSPDAVRRPDEHALDAALVEQASAIATHRPASAAAARGFVVNGQAAAFGYHLYYLTSGGPGRYRVVRQVWTSQDDTPVSTSVVTEVEL